MFQLKVEIIWYLSLTAWLISLSRMLSSSIHAVAKGISSFILSLWYPLSPRMKIECITLLYFPEPLFFFKSTKLGFLHFNLEEKNEDRTFWNGHQAAVSYDFNGYFPGNVGNGKSMVMKIGTPDVMLPKASVWVLMQTRADEVD